MLCHTVALSMSGTNKFERRRTNLMLVYAMFSFTAFAALHAPASPYVPFWASFNLC